MSLNLLVVDDSAIMRSMVVKSLKMGGVPINQVHTAANGQEGLDLLASEWIDVALVDLNMPVLDGMSMLEQLREIDDHKELKVIVISTEGSQPRIDRVRELGAEFVRKPFKPEELKNLIVRLTGVSEDELEFATAEHGDEDF